MQYQSLEFVTHVYKQDFPLVSFSSEAYKNDLFL